MDPIVGYLSLAVVLVLVSLLCYATVKYYADPLTMHPLATAVVVCSLFVGLFSVMLLPVDVFVLTFEAKHSFLVRDAYFVCFALLAVLAFICIPFAYFFTEDFESGAELDQQPCCTRTMSAAKYTSLTLAVVLILFFIGLLIEPGTSVHMANKEEFTKWVGNLMDVSSGGAGERALLLSTAVLTAIGCVNVVLYSGYGLFALPFRLLRSPREAEQHQQLKADFDQLRIRERKKEIQNKYSRSNRLGTQDLRELANLNRQEKLLSRLRDTMEAPSSSPCSTWLLQVLFPFRVALGLSFLAASVLVVVSAFLTSLDKALNSFCGMHCGFLIDRPHIFNPMDKMLVALSQYFPSDYIALSFFTLYMFVTSLYGIFRIGIRVCGIEIFKIKRRATWPQALLLCALLLMVMILSLAVLVLTLAPQYATFGSQTIPSTEFGAERVPCAVGSLSAVFRSSADQTTSEGDCAMSQLAMIMARISIGMPLFSLLVYACVWLFVLVAVITFFREYARKEPDATEVEDPDDLELTGLLSRSSYA